MKILGMIPNDPTLGCESSRFGHLQESQVVCAVFMFRSNRILDRLFHPLDITEIWSKSLDCQSVRIYCCSYFHVDIQQPDIISRSGSALQKSERLGKLYGACSHRRCAQLLREHDRVKKLRQCYAINSIPGYCGRIVSRTFRQLFFKPFCIF